MNSQINALLGQSIQCFEQGKQDEAERLLARILQMHAKNFDALHILGVIKGIKNDQQEAIRLFKKAIAIDANNNFVQFNLAKALSEIGKDEDAIVHYKKAVQLAPRHIEAWLNFGVSLSNLKRFEDALACYEKVLGLNPHYGQAWVNIGVAFYKLARYEEALQAYDKALAMVPDHAESWSNTGAALEKLQRYPAAVMAYEKALSFNPNLAETWFNYGAALRKLKRYDDAVQAYNQAFLLNPSNAEVWFESGNVLCELRMYEAALSAFDKCIEMHPDYADAWSCKGTVHTILRQYEQAQSAFDQALALQPDLAVAWLNKGLFFSEKKQFAEAQQAYAQALKIKPELDYLYGKWLSCKLMLCDWTGLDDAFKSLQALIDDKRVPIDPFSLFPMTDDPLLEKRYAQFYTEKMYPDRRAQIQWPLPSKDARIKIAYFSADFHEHATAYLMAELFEKHDRNRFEIIAFSFGPASQSAMRNRIATAMDQFIDVREKSEQQIAALSRSLGIDIAVDLKGHTRDNRMDIFAHGAAPVQLSYLGYAATSGASYMDYILADATLIGDELAANYSEKIVRLPNSYQVNDRLRVISDRQFSRAELGLPEAGFVFACFNSNYKIAPESFDIWMRLLHQVPGSVFWIFQDSAHVVENLQAEAERRGIAKERLVFAPHMALSLHLARHRQADLFLDTFNCNAHTTASDALWAGLPVVTRLGNTFSSRVAASLLTAAGLSDLIAANNDEYEALALKLARDHGMLAGYKQKLEQTRLSCPLFDSGLFTQHLETAYQAMHARHLAGLPPDHLDVAS